MSQTAPYYSPVSLAILGGFDDDDDGDGLPFNARLRDELLKRPSSTAAVVNGGRDTPPHLPPAPAAGAAAHGYKPISRHLFDAVFGNDSDGGFATSALQPGTTRKDADPKALSQPPTNTTTTKQQQHMGYRPASHAIFEGFSDVDDDDDDDYDDDETDAEESDSYGDIWDWDEDEEEEGLGDSMKEAKGRDTLVQTKSSGRNRSQPVSSTQAFDLLDDFEHQPGPNLTSDKVPQEQLQPGIQGPRVPPSVSGLLVDFMPPHPDDGVGSRQTDMTAALCRNKGSVAPADLPGYFAPEDLSFGQRYQVEDATSSVAIKNQRTVAVDIEGERECVVCTDSKGATEFPVASVTKACAHPPSTCLECVATSIRTDLNNRLWNEIKCPECGQVLQYDDVQRFADEETKERYQNLSFRYAISAADNFVWCTSGCGYGQVHDSGIDQPIVICMLCNHRSCFHHKVAWHENLTCDEYDLLQADPVNFRSRFDIENEAAEQEAAARRAQEDADRAFAQSLLAEEQREADRERMEQERKERKKREAEEEKKRRERERQAEIAREQAARRKAEEAATAKTIASTTKPCPGCEAPIEKNSGCSHMTCATCRYEFCWYCNAKYKHGHHDPYCGMRRRH